MPETETKTAKPIPNYRIRILTPHVVLENVEALKEDKPFLMRAELELGARFIQAVAMPTLVDMLGFSGGGGAPAYGFLVPYPQAERGRVLFISLAPNTPFYLPVEDMGRIDMSLREPKLHWEPLGVTQSMGALLTHFLLRGSDGVAEIVKNAEEEGAAVVDMIDYQIPELLQKKILPGRIAQAVKP
jgi:hypothetical protein